jgi:hypothetical protein
MDRGGKVIPDEAVEAAAPLLYKVAADYAYDSDGWETVAEEQRELWRADARRILEAAAPHLTRAAQAQAWDEGWEAGSSDETDSYNGPAAVTTPNPYKKDEEAQ